MAAAALVRPDRLDKPSLMLAGQPEEEVSKHSHLALTVDEMKHTLASLDSHTIMKIVSYPLQCDHSITSRLLLEDFLKFSNGFRDRLCVKFPE